MAKGAGMAKGKEKRNAPRTATRLGKGTAFKGTLRFEQSVTINGYFEGEINAAGFLYIEEGADVQANITADSVVIAGKVHGNIYATGTLEMLSTGEIYGNVKAAKLRIADGVVFEGQCEMLKSSSQVDIFAAPVDQLKESVQRV
jgi:cytoskeletal protein CcmA (bactofilin family)